MTDGVDPIPQDLEETTATVRKGLVPLPQDERFAPTFDCAYEYVDTATGRRFNISPHEVADEKARWHQLYLLSELVPVGRLFTYYPDGSPYYCTHERCDELERKYGPNALVSKLRERGLHPAARCTLGPLDGVERYYATLEECAAVIVRAIADNQRYAARRELTEQEHIWRESMRAGEPLDEPEDADSPDPGLFKDCRTRIGGPLSAEFKATILDYLNEPALEKWRQIRRLVINGFHPLGMAWKLFDSSASLKDDGRYPEPEVLRKALRYAVEKRMRNSRESWRKQAPLT